MTSICLAEKLGEWWHYVLKEDHDCFISLVCRDRNNESIVEVPP